MPVVPFGSGYGTELDRRDDELGDPVSRPDEGPGPGRPVPAVPVITIVVAFGNGYGALLVRTPVPLPVPVTHEIKDAVPVGLKPEVELGNGNGGELVPETGNDDADPTKDDSTVEFGSG